MCLSIMKTKNYNVSIHWRSLGNKPNYFVLRDSYCDKEMVKRTQFVVSQIIVMQSITKTYGSFGFFWLLRNKANVRQDKSEKGV